MPVPRVESIPEDLVIGEDILQSALNCTKRGKHFATLLLKSVWPELYNIDKWPTTGMGQEARHP